MGEIQNESTATFIQSQLHSVIASQRATIESLRDSIAKNYVPRTDFQTVQTRLEQSENEIIQLREQLETTLEEKNERDEQLEAAHRLSSRLQSELDDLHTKLTSTYEVLDAACAKIDQERADFEESLKKIRRTTEGEIRKNSELYAKTLAIEQTYVAQRQALETKTSELKQLEKRFNQQEQRATNRINKLAVKLEQEKFISREILHSTANQSKSKK